MEAFTNKGRFKDFLEKIPVKVGFGFLKRSMKFFLVKPRATPNIINAMAKFNAIVVSGFQFSFTPSSTSVSIAAYCFVSNIPLFIYLNC